MSIYLILLILVGFVFLAHIFKCFTKDYWQNTFLQHNIYSLPKAAIIGVLFSVGLIGGQMVVENYVPYADIRVWGERDSENSVTVDVNAEGNITVTDAEGNQEVVGVTHWGFRKLASVLCLLVIFYFSPKITTFMTSRGEVRNEISPFMYLIMAFIFLLIGSSIGSTLVWILAFYLWDKSAVNFYKKNWDDNLIEYREKYQEHFAPRLTWIFNTFTFLILLVTLFTMGAS